MTYYLSNIWILEDYIARTNFLLNIVYTIQAQLWELLRDVVLCLCLNSSLVYWDYSTSSTKKRERRGESVYTCVCERPCVECGGEKMKRTSEAQHCDSPFIVFTPCQSQNLKQQPASFSDSPVSPPPFIALGLQACIQPCLGLYVGSENLNTNLYACTIRSPTCSTISAASIGAFPSCYQVHSFRRNTPVTEEHWVAWPEAAAFSSFPFHWWWNWTSRGISSPETSYILSLG